MAEDVRGGPGHLGCAEAQGRRQVRVWRGRGPAQGLCDSTEPGWAVGAGAGLATQALSEHPLLLHSFA